MPALPAGRAVPVVVSLWVVIDVSGRFRVAALGREATTAVVTAGFLVATGRTMGLVMTAGAVLVVVFASFVVG